MAKKHFITFKHLQGSKKNIPGVANKEDLQPRLIQEIQMIGGKERPILKLDESFVPKIALLDEEVDIRLTEKEEKLPKRVQEKILERRTEEADLRIRANEMLKEYLRSYEDRGAIKVLEWDYIVDEESPEVKGSNISQLSEIALADFADRGLEVPAHLKKASVAPVATEKSGVIVKQGLSKKVKSEDD